jgi:hypothetical protein
MPKLLALLACEKVIFEMNTTVPSLIGIFQGMNVPIREAPLPENAIAPNKWAVFALWEHEAEEKGVEYVQKMEITAPSGVVFGRGEARFKVIEDLDMQSRTSTEMIGMPISEEGYMKINVWLEGVEGAAGEYKFFIRHVRSGANAETSDSITKSVN